MRDPVQFNVYVGRRGGKFYRVRVFENRRDMHAFFTAQGKLPGSPAHWKRLKGDFEAQVNHWIAYDNHGKRSRCIGQILFHRKRMGVGIVSHEMTHVALYHVCRFAGSKLDPMNKRQDEKNAWLQGWLVTQFWRAYYSLVEPKRA